MKLVMIRALVAAGIAWTICVGAVMYAKGTLSHRSIAIVLFVQILIWLGIKSLKKCAHTVCELSNHTELPAIILAVASIFIPFFGLGIYNLSNSQAHILQLLPNLFLAWLAFVEPEMALIAKAKTRNLETKGD